MNIDIQILILITLNPSNLSHHIHISYAYGHTKASWSITYHINAMSDAMVGLGLRER